MPAGVLLVKILGTNEDLIKAVDGAGKSVAGLEDKFAKVGAKMTSIGGSMTKNITLPIVAAGGALLALGGNFDSAFDTIRAGTGATGEALDGLQKDFLKVYKSVPIAMEDAGWMIAEYNTRLGSSGEALTDLSEKTALLSKLTGVDLKTAVTGVSKMSSVWGLNAEGASYHLDTLLNVSQLTGKSIDGFTSTLTDNAATFKLLGYDITQATALIGTLEKSGVEAGSVMGALGIFARKAAEGGKDIQTYFPEAIQAIKNAGSESDAAALAVEVFGKSGAQMAMLIREGKFNVEDMTLALTTGGDSIRGLAGETFDYGEKLEVLKQKIAVDFMPVAMKMFDVINNLIPVVSAIAGKIGSVMGAFANLNPQIQTIILGFIGLLAAIGPILTIVGNLITLGGALAAVIGFIVSPIGLVVLAIAGLVAAGVLIYRNWETISTKAREIWGAIGSFFTKTIGGWVTNAFAWGSNLLQGFIDGLKSKITAVTDVFTGIAKKLKALLGFGSPTELGPGRYADEWMPNLMKMFIGDIERFTPKLQTKLAMVLPTGSPQIASGGSGGSVADINNIINISQLTVREEADIERISKHLFDLIQSSTRGRGYHGI